MQVSKPVSVTRAAYLFIIIDAQLSAYSLITGQKLLRLDYSNSLLSDGKTTFIFALSNTGFPLNRKVGENYRKSGNWKDRRMSGKSQGILVYVRKNIGHLIAAVMGKDISVLL